MRNIPSGLSFLLLARSGLLSVFIAPEQHLSILRRERELRLRRRVVKERQLVCCPSPSVCHHIPHYLHSTNSLFLSCSVVAGCPLRIQWGRPRPLGNIDRAQASQIGRQAHDGNTPQGNIPEGGDPSQQQQQENAESATQNFEALIAPPPSEDNVEKYPSQLAT